MTNSNECPYCKKEIVAGTIKCPYCQEWLNKKSITFKNPYVKFVILVVVTTFSTAVISRLFMNNYVENILKEPQRYRKDSKLQIINHRLLKTKKGFSVVGEIMNKENFTWESVTILVAFRDKKKVVSNVSSEYIPNLKANKPRAFQVDFGCSDIVYDPLLHASYEIEIEDGYGRKP